MWVGGTILAVSLALATVVGARALEQQPAFCASCHEERENYDRWLSSGAAAVHKNCIECHTGPGLVGILHGQARGLRHVDAAPASGWQVVQEDDGLTVLLSGVSGGLVDETLAATVTRALASQGAASRT